MEVVIKKITFLIFLIIFNIFNFIIINKIYGEGEEKNLEIYFDEPNFWIIKMNLSYQK
jgi:hypothetical protein